VRAAGEVRLTTRELIPCPSPSSVSAVAGPRRKQPKVAVRTAIGAGRVSAPPGGNAFWFRDRTFRRAS
jgi:hypothetical protein